MIRLVSLTSNIVCSGVSVRTGATLSTVGVDNSISSVGLTRMVDCCLNSIMLVILRFSIFAYCYISVLLPIHENLHPALLLLPIGLPKKRAM